MRAEFAVELEMGPLTKKINILFGKPGAVMMDDVHGQVVSAAGRIPADVETKKTYLADTIIVVIRRNAKKSHENYCGCVGNLEGQSYLKRVRKLGRSNLGVGRQR